MDELTPIYRVEHFLDTIVNGSANPYDPIYRIEKYLAKIAGEDVEVPTPIYRVEMYLAYLCGMDVTIPDPIYRIEMYLAKKCGMEVETPVPIYRIEYWLAEWAEQSGGTWTTITGVSPLALANALAHSIKSLTQYGKCVQASTPTPSAPVDIVCNNGALRMVDDELPAAYKRVLGFECDNNAMWQITGFKLKGSDTVRISFSVNAACNVFGCYQGADATDNYDLYVSTSSNAKYFRYGGGTYLSAWSAADLGERFDVVYTPYGSQGMPQDSTWSPLTFTSANDLLIGATTFTGTSAKLKGDLYGNIIVDGRLKLIPCERVSDGALGYYDTYGATFYEPYEGFDGAVSLGYDGSHYSLTVVGTDEVLTVGSPVDIPTTPIIRAYINQSHKIAGSMDTMARITVDVGKTYRLRWTNTDSATVGTIFDFGFVELGGYVGETVTQAQLTTPQDVPSVTLTADFPYLLVRMDSQKYMTNIKSGYLVCEEITQTVTDIPMLLSVNDYKDEAEIIGGAVTRNCRIVAFNGTEDNWSADFNTASGTIARFYMAGFGTGASGRSRLLCTHFKFSTGNADGVCFIAASGHIFFERLIADGFDTKEKWLAWLQGNPIICVVPLAEPTTEQTTAHSLNTSEGTNVVSVTSEVDPVELEVEYMGVSA